MDPTQGDDATHVVELTDEQQEAADNAAFEAGFAAVHGDEPAPDAATSQDDATTQANPDAAGEPADVQMAPASAEDEAAAAAAAQAEAQRKAEEEANAPVTITKAQFNRLMAVAEEVPSLRDQVTKANDTVAGRLGALQQSVQALKKQSGKGNVAATLKLARMAETFPELAEALREDLGAAFGGADQQEGQQDEQQATGQQQDPPAAAPVNPLELPEVQQVLREKEEAITEAVHPGFRTLSDTPEFTEWVATLPAAAVDLLNSTWSSTVMVPALNDFKKWKDERAAKQAAAATTKQQNDKRLDRGIAPTDGAGRSGPTVDEDAAFEAGFRAVRG